MSALDFNDFGAFFREVYGYPPFPWQSRLARQVLEQGAFPEALDLPTGSGKTAAIDVAVFSLAADLAAGTRRLPCRIAFVVDRRTVVDQSFYRAEWLSRRLKESVPGTVVHRVAEQLKALSGSDDPLHVALLRGAMPRDDSRVANPAQPAVLVSTVDQVGSRLFFRGYGVSDGMRPVHAGLLGNDVLLLLDEVHLARPFRDTLRMLERYHAGRIGGVLPRRFQIAELSATHRDDGAVPFRLDAGDRGDERLRQRLGARKPASLETVKVSGGEPSRLAALAKKMAAAAAAAVSAGRAIGVVVNRVQTARLIHRALSDRGLDAALWLLTGRMRPLDRQVLEETLRRRFAIDRERDSTARPAVLVSTQCIEAGADFDFDVLLTECASLDALRQRFGRLNRAGKVQDAFGSVFARSDIDKSDPIYGEAAAATWAYLTEQPEVDFGIEALVLPEGEPLRRLLAPAATSPILLPAHLDAWSQTAPAPRPDPDISLWLHGPQAPSVEVQLVWRADIDEEALDVRHDAEPANEFGDAGIDALAERLEACPPLSSESLSLPVWAARGWLQGEDAVADATLADVEAGFVVEEKGRRPGGRGVVIRRDGKYRIATPAEIRPWDTVIVPCAYGGLRNGNWDPNATDVVTDLAEGAHLRQRGRAVLRLVEGLWPGGEVPYPAGDDGESRSDDLERIRDFIAGGRDACGVEHLNSEDRSEVIRILLDEFEKRQGPRLIPVSGRGGDRWVVVSRHSTTLAKPAAGLVSPDLALDGDDLCLIGKAVPLNRHLAGVGGLAEGFARRCGLPESLVSDLQLAGELHDLGKHDPRFQCLLHGGSEYRALTASEPLAKSFMSPRNRRLREEARWRAGYPAGTRHELLSVALLLEADGFRERAHDWELVLHLVASHHGHCRPFAPVEPEPGGEPLRVEVELNGRVLSASAAHGLAALDSGVSDRFYALIERYGCHGLAWLEAILRLADHRRSAQEEKEGEGGWSSWN